MRASEARRRPCAADLTSTNDSSARPAGGASGAVLARAVLRPTDDCRFPGASAPDRDPFGCRCLSSAGRSPWMSMAFGRHPGRVMPEPVGSAMVCSDRHAGAELMSEFTEMARRLGSSVEQVAAGICFDAEAQGVRGPGVTSRDRRAGEDCSPWERAPAGRRRHQIANGRRRAPRADARRVRSGPTRQMPERVGPLRMARERCSGPRQRV
jgi:hypothetical protein